MDGSGLGNIVEMEEGESRFVKWRVEGGKEVGVGVVVEGAFSRAVNHDIHLMSFRAKRATRQKSLIRSRVAQDDFSISLSHITAANQR